MDMVLIPYVKLSPQHLQKNLKIMEEGNKLLKKWGVHFLGRRKLRTFRDLLWKGKYVDQIPADEYAAISAVRSIQDEMLSAFAPMVTLRAKVWASRTEGGKVAAFEHLYQEANIAFLDSLYGYLGRSKKANFMTYCYWAINRRLRRAIEAEKFKLVPPSADNARKLVREYEQFRQEYGKPITLDEYVVMLNLDKEEQSILVMALAKVLPASDMGNSDDSFDGKVTLDYSSCAAELDENSVERDVDSRELKHALKKCIALAGLTEFQKELLLSAAESDRGWKAEIARKYGLSPNRAGQAFKRAVEKVRQVYRRLKQRNEL